MPGRIRRLPSAALVISVIALFIALGGGAYAVSVAKKNSVVSKSIENGQVKTKDLAKNAVNSAKVANNSLTGNDVKESSLGAVPLATHATGADSATNASHATSADTATNASTVGGETVKKFFMKGPANTPETEILHLDGLSISAGCDGTARPIVDASSDTTTSQLKVHGTGSGGVAFSDGWSTGSSGTAIGLIGGVLGSGTGTYSTAGGQVVSFSYSWDDPPTYGGQAVCTVVGQAIEG